MRTLYESLDKYIAGESISDFFCDKCNKKVDVSKRVCLSELPNVLVIHLQRIVYDFDMQMNSKINSKLEFPNYLNLEPYTEEGLEARERKAPPKQTGEEGEEAFLNIANTASTGNEKGAANVAQDNDPFHGKGEMYYQYKLVGVVVHYGTADAGHYYSYINTNRGGIITIYF